MVTGYVDVNELLGGIDINRVIELGKMAPIVKFDAAGNRHVGVGPEATGFTDIFFTPGGGVKDPKPDDIIRRTGKTRAETEQDNLATAAGISRPHWDSLSKYDQDQRLGGGRSSDRADEIRRQVNNPNHYYYNHYMNRKARGEEWKSGNKNAGGPVGNYAYGGATPGAHPGKPMRTCLLYTSPSPRDS